MSALGVQVTYWGRSQPGAQDSECGGPAVIGPGQTVDPSCDLHAVSGADQVTVQLFDVAFR